MSKPLNPETITGQQRLDAKAAAEKESRRADQKQHADKLLQGFAKIDDNAPNRAIWELVQNACDLTKKCRVTIDYRNGGFAFSHNGKPFKSKTLIALIKQVSSKGDGEGDEIGRFGTGFITTHAFGRKFTINSFLEVDGKYIRISDFLIDRTPMEWEAMVDKLEEQEQNVYDVIEHGEVVEDPEWLTTLTYLPGSEIESKYISNSFTHLHEYIPIVLTINEHLVSVSVIAEDGTQKTYAKGNKVEQSNIWVTPIEIGSETREVYSLKDANGDIEIVLPLKTGREAYPISKSIARLFLYYPLVGTENWGCNYIIHSKLFKPTEPRDGIHLRSNNEQVQTDEEINRGLIESASQLIFDFVRLNASTIAHPLYLAPVDFESASGKPLLDDYFEGLRNSWVACFKQCLLVETENGNQAPSATVFLNSELLLDDASTPSVYNLAKMAWNNLPSSNVVKTWTQTIGRWEDETLTRKGIKELIAEIQQVGRLAAFESEEDLQTTYRYLLAFGHGDLFNKYKLLPNIDGEFRLLAALNSKVNLAPVLIDIARVIAPEVPGKHIHDSFKFSFELTPYKRSDYSKDITDQVTRIIKENATPNTIAQPFFEKMVDYCRIATSIESLSSPSQMVRLISRSYGFSDTLIEIPVAEGEEIDNRTAQKRLLQVFLNDVANQQPTWVEANLPVLEEAIVIMGNYKEYNDLLLSARIFPNRLNEVCLQSSLKIDRGIPEELKKMYDRICRPSISVDGTLVHPRFEKYLTQQEGRTPKSIGTELESTLSSDGQYYGINNHPYRSDIIRIIELITSTITWGDYFPYLDIRKANIMLDTVSGATKGAMFKIMNLPPEKVDMLGKLAEKEDLEQILALGLSVSEKMKDIIEHLEGLPQEQFDLLKKLAESGQFENVIALGIAAWDEEQKTKADFEFKHAIGKRIEGVIREKVGRDLAPFSVVVQDVQNGQDIVIKKGSSPIFYIEVKSRWKVDSSIMMSKNQFMNAAENKDKHSLCCIEMSDYKKGEQARYQVDNVNIIFDRIKFVNTVGKELDPLVKDIFKSTDLENEITLTGDYKATIPQRLIRKGVDIDAFISDLSKRLTPQ